MFRADCCGEVQHHKINTIKVPRVVRRVRYNYGSHYSEGTEIVKEEKWCPTCIQEKGFPEIEIRGEKNVYIKEEKIEKDYAYKDRSTVDSKY